MDEYHRICTVFDRCACLLVPSSGLPQCLISIYESAFTLKYQEIGLLSLSLSLSLALPLVFIRKFKGMCRCRMSEHQKMCASITRYAQCYTDVCGYWYPLLNVHTVLFLCMKGYSYPSVRRYLGTVFLSIKSCAAVSREM